jgi:hypothetical protein
MLIPDPIERTHKSFKDEALAIIMYASQQAWYKDGYEVCKICHEQVSSTSYWHTKGMPII